MKRIKVNSFFKDLKNSAEVPLRRSEMIENAPNTPLAESYPANTLAQTLHPQNFPLRVCSRKAEEDYVIAELLPGDGEKAFWFKAGQSLAVKLEKDGKSSSHSLHVISLPGEKKITVYAPKSVDPEAYSRLSDENNDSLLGVSFEGNFVYSPLRDGKNIVILTDVNGIALSSSLALTAASTYDDVNPEIIYFDPSGKFPAREFIENKNNVSAVLIKNISDFSVKGEKSFFVCGSAEFCSSVKEMLNGCRTRVLLLGTIKECSGEKYHTCKVICKGNNYEVKCREGEKLLRALERADIPVNARCAEGECGYCRSKLLEGQVKPLSESEFRTAADISYGYIHPCSVTAISDLTLEI